MDKKKKVIDFKKFEIIKEGQKNVKGGVWDVVAPKTKMGTVKGRFLPTACDNAS